MTTDATEPKALRLARYLKEFVGLRSTTIRDVDKYESVLWFGEMPQESQCESPAWNDGFEPGDPWLEVHKQQFPTPPAPPETILPWIDQEALKRATTEIPRLRSTKSEPDLAAEVSDGEEPPLIERQLQDYPDVRKAYERYLPAWRAWSDEYRRREAIQKVYAELFHLHTQVQKQGEIVELVLGLGLLDWPGSDKTKGAPIRRHIITARVDLHFDLAAGLIQLDAAADGPQLRIEDDMLDAELRPERGHYAIVEQQLRAIDDDIWNRPTIFKAIKSWAEACHPDSQWSPDLQPAVGTAAKPAASFAPALVLRKRTQGGMLRIYESMINQLSHDPDEAPPGWRGLIDDEDDNEHPEPAPAPDAAAAPQHPDPQETFFPLPANREQRRIVQAIGLRRGVLVQGPPGTGKSHTIANLICHLLAIGKRVLITAETARALRVLKEKLPTGIQPLCVSLLGQSGDAFAELNSAVQGITARFASWTPKSHDERIAEIDRELATRRRSLAHIDTELLTLREDETSEYNLMNGAYHGTASAIARMVAKDRDRLGWLQVPLEATDDPPVSGGDLREWLRIQRTHDSCAVANAKLRVVDSGALPPPEAFASAVAAEREAEQAVQQIARLQSHPAYRQIVAMQPDHRAVLDRELREMNDRRRKLLGRTYNWMAEALSAALGGRQALWQALLQRSQGLIGRIEQLLESLDSSSVTIPPERQLTRVRADAEAVIRHLKAGGKWTKFLFMTPKTIRGRAYLRDQVTVNGQPADTESQLRALCSHIDVDLAFVDLDAVWADYGGLPPGSQREIRLAAIKEQLASLADVLSYAQTCLGFGQNRYAEAPVIAAPDWLNGEAEKWLEVIEAAEIEERRRMAAEQVTVCLQDLESVRDLHDAHPVASALVRAIAQRNITGYSQAYEKLRQVEQTRHDEGLRKRIEATLVTAVPQLVDAAASTIEDTAWDSRFNEWERAWRWAIADNWLRKRSDLSYQDQLWQRRGRMEKDIGELLAEAAALRAWTHFFNRLSNREAAALRAWREAVRAMGKGTGRSARIERLRREARQYMEQCREAIPVWIMPRYLVAEMVDPAPNRYDVVIIDEASQLGVDSLFLFYIARKMVVVGDDQQISPYGVGIADQAIADLQDHYLEGIPYQTALGAQSSLYANAKIRFGQNIVLREHFRCMPEIIQFSNDLCYASNGTPLDPLRAYPANRLRPLVVRHVKDGYRAGSPEHAVNEAEADAIVAQIVACIADGRYAGQTMGVISLQGDAQAKLIERKLLDTLEPEIIEERRLICGDAYAFQGDERHTIFLSMVAAPNERIGALANESARQRFNVAASRAQDQLWLFHSAGLEALSPVCMRYRLLSYMLSPTRQIPAPENQRFESRFEEDVFRIVRERGFHIRTQVCVGDPTSHRYRIDLVVEGMQGRLAVECDGERWHGPERYEQDMARQRDLERAGWQFVRIRGGDFYRDPARATSPLWAELDRLGIMSGGIDEVAAEPPPPADRQTFGRKEASEVNGSGPSATDPDDEHPTPEPGPNDREQGQADHEQADSVPDRDAAIPQRTGIPTLAEYATYEGVAGPDPRTVNTGAVADGLVRIIEIEGPMLAKRAYDIYLRGCRIRRLGGELKSTMNKALTSAIRQGRVISENERGETGLIFSSVRVKGSLPVRPRRRGPRTLEEIPPGELRYVGRYVLEHCHVDPGSDDHLRAILDAFDLKRLTTQVGTTLLEILERRDEAGDDLFGG